MLESDFFSFGSSKGRLQKSIFITLLFTSKAMTSLWWRRPHFSFVSLQGQNTALSCCLQQSKATVWRWRGQIQRLNISLLLRRLLCLEQSYKCGTNSMLTFATWWRELPCASRIDRGRPRHCPLKIHEPPVFGRLCVWWVGNSICFGKSEEKLTEEPSKTHLH